MACGAMNLCRAPLTHGVSRIVSACHAPHRAVPHRAVLLLPRLLLLHRSGFLSAHLVKELASLLSSTPTATGSRSVCNAPRAPLIAHT